MCDDFFMDFIDFSRKIYETFFLRWGMPCGYMELPTISLFPGLVKTKTLGVNVFIVSNT